MSESVKDPTEIVPTQKVFTLKEARYICPSFQTISDLNPQMYRYLVRTTATGLVKPLLLAGTRAFRSFLLHEV